MTTAPSTFGEATYETGPESSSPAASPDQQAAPVDINDPALTSEVLTDNPAADAYAVPPPLPDGKHRAKLKQVDIKDPKGQLQRFMASMATWENPPKPFLCTNVESSIIDHSGKFDGIKLTDYWVKTLPNRSGTSPIATILRALKVDLSKRQFSGGTGRFTAGELMNLFLGELAKEPECLVESVWTAGCQNCQEAAGKRGEKKPKDFLVGMHRFPQLRSGGHEPVVQCPTCKGSVRAQARLVGYFPLP